MVFSLSGCILSPLDGDQVASTSAAVSLQGMHINPAASVQVRAWNFGAGVNENLGAPLIASTTSAFAMERPLYAWQGSRTLASRFWRTGPAGGKCAIVSATTAVGGASYDVMTLDSGYSSCLSAHPTTTDFYTSCAANTEHTASIYTSDWGEKVVTQANLNSLAGTLQHLVTVTVDNYQPTPYLHCNASNPAGCPEGGAGDPEKWKYYAPNASKVAVVGSPVLPFSIAPSREDPMTIYIDDMSSLSHGLRVEGNELVWTINFESVGPEIRMNCIRNAACAFVDGRTIDFASPKAELRFRLKVKGGQVGFTTATATFTGGTPGSDATRAATAIGTAITEKLNSDETIRAAVGAALGRLVRMAAGLGVDEGPVGGVTLSGGVMRVRPACEK